VFPGPLEDAGPDLASFLGLPPDPVRRFRPWYELGLHDGAPYAAARTARGCPFRCTYCASQRLTGPFAPREAEDVASELAALSRLGVRDVAFYDDALLVDFEQRLGLVLREVGRRALPLRFHTPNGLHARLITPEAAETLTRSDFATVRLSLETVDRERQGATGGKVAANDVARAVRLLVDAGIPREKLGVYLLLGLPDQPLDEVRRGVEFALSLGVRPYVAEFSPIPGTLDWDRLVDARVIPQDIDPILTNNSVYHRLFAGYDPRELEALLRRCRRGGTGRPSALGGESAGTPFLDTGVGVS
jgi:radical SAM superfamily enzyme YgiQ (UPF0313 family)